MKRVLARFVLGVILTGIVCSGVSDSSPQTSEIGNRDEIAATNDSEGGALFADVTSKTKRAMTSPLQESTTSSVPVSDGGFATLQCTLPEETEIVSLLSSTNIEVLDFSQSGRFLSLDVLVSDEGDAKCQLNAISPDEGADILDFFFYALGGFIAVSPLGKDAAFFLLAREHLGSSATFLDSKINLLYDGLSSQYIDSSSTHLSEGIDLSGSVHVSGEINMKMDNGSLEPMSRVLVEVWSFGLVDELLGSGFTNETGNYYVTLDSSLFNAIGFIPIERSLYLKIHAAGKTFRLAPEFLFSTITSYRVLSPKVNGVTQNSQVQIDVTLKGPEAGLTTQAFMGSQGYGFAEKFAIVLGGIPENAFLGIPLIVQYPFSGETAFSYAIISGLTGGKFGDWWTQMHEYGHYVQHVMGVYDATLGEILLNWPTHDQNGDHLEDKASKEYAMDLVWTESLATVMGAVCYEYFEDDIKDRYYAQEIQNQIVDLENCYYGDSNGHTFLNAGEGQEKSVRAYLWDLYDDSPNETHDRAALGFRGFWDVCFADGVTDLTSFQEKLLRQMPDLKGRNSLLLAEQMIAPEIVEIEKQADGSLAVVFRPGGSALHPNNQLTFILESPDGEREAFLLVVTLPSGFSGRDLVQVSIDKDILDLRANLMSPYPYGNLTIWGRNDENNVTSGPYISPSRPILVAGEGWLLEPKDFGFPQSYVSSSTEKSLALDGLSIETTRLRCGFIENQKIVLSCRKEGFGEAYLKLDFDRAISQITYEYSLWGDREYMDDGISHFEVFADEEDALEAGLDPIFDVNALYLSQVRDLPDIEQTSLPAGTKSVAFNARSLQAGTHNKGRVCLGTICIIP